MNRTFKQFFYSSSIVVLSASSFVGAVYLECVGTNAMRESPKDAFDRDEIKDVIRRKLLSQANLDDLKKNGIVVVDNILSSRELTDARDEIDDLILNTTSFEKNGHDDVHVRTDSVFWISESVGTEHKSPLSAGLLNALRKVRSIPNELLGNGNAQSKLDSHDDDSNYGVPFSNQLACYDGQRSHYIAHRDAPEKLKDGFTHPLRWLLQTALEDREITIILYLNEEVWDSTGDNTMETNTNGMLRCYLNTEEDDMTGASATEVIDIAPIGGRMVIFDSRRVLHEVCPSLNRRRALTCWVGGGHSAYQWLRPFCLPYDEIDWKLLRAKYFKW
jgi:hypothetical protein